MEQVPRGSGTIELAVVLRFVDIAVDALAEAREEIDALNVYPVPDGDTGTNMYLTVAAARDAFREAVRDGSGDGVLLAGLAGLRRGALLGARGNSGVILSQMLGAVATTVRFEVTIWRRVLSPIFVLGATTRYFTRLVVARTASE